MKNHYDRREMRVEFPLAIATRVKVASSTDGDTFNGIDFEVKDGIEKGFEP
jgi:hypothetical protein